MENLRQLLQKELAKDTQESLENYKRYLTEKEVLKIEEGKKTVEDYASKIAGKVLKGYHGTALKKLDRAASCQRKVKEITITVDWKRSRTWGSNPQATAGIFYQDNGFDSFTSERIGGCGYDKESTATKQVLNQCTALLKELYEIKEQQPHLSNNEVIGYGAGYGVLPYFEGGVGFNCHRHILEKIGFTYRHISSTKTTDVYLFTR